MPACTGVRAPACVRTGDGTKIITAHTNGKVNLIDLATQAVTQVGQVRRRRVVRVRRASSEPTARRAPRRAAPGRPAGVSLCQRDGRCRLGFVWRARVCVSVRRRRRPVWSLDLAARRRLGQMALVRMPCVVCRASRAMYSVVTAFATVIGTVVRSGRLTRSSFARRHAHTHARQARICANA